MSTMSSVDLVDDVVELEAVVLDEVLPQLLDGAVVVDLALEEFGDLALAVVLEELVGGHEAAAYP